MIGFSVTADFINADGGSSRQTVLLSLDTDAADGFDGKPMLDVRLADDSDVIVTVDVEDAYAAIYEIRQQIREWERQRAQDASGVAQ